MNSLQLQNGMLFLWNKHKLYADLRLSIWYVLCLMSNTESLNCILSLPKLRGLKISCRMLLEVESFVVHRSCFCATRQRGTTRHTVLHNSENKTWISEKFQDEKNLSYTHWRYSALDTKILYKFETFLCTYSCTYVYDEHSYKCREGRT